MCRRLPAVALLFALAAPAPAGVISGYDPASQASHDTYDRFSSGFPTAPVANSSSAFVAAGIDLSGVGWLANNAGTGVTLISPQHYVTAFHVSVPSNAEVRFVNAAGTVMTYTTAGTPLRIDPDSAGPLPPTDLLLGTLTAPIPAADGIRFFGVAGVTEAQALARPILAYGRNDPAYQTTSPHLGTNVIDGFLQATLGSFGDSTRVMRYDWTPANAGEIYLIGGDSGSPDFVRANGDLALIGVNYGVSRGTTEPTPGVDYSASTFLPEYIDELNAAMAGSGYQVTVVPVPEPAGLLAVAGTTLAVGLIRRRRRAAGLSA